MTLGTELYCLLARRGQMLPRHVAFQLDAMPLDKAESLNGSISDLIGLRNIANVPIPEALQRARENNRAARRPFEADLLFTMGLESVVGQPFSMESVAAVVQMVNEGLERIHTTQVHADVCFTPGNHMGVGDRLILHAVANGYAQQHPDKKVVVDGGYFKGWLDLFHSDCQVLDHSPAGAEMIEALDGKFEHWHHYTGKSPWECCAKLAGTTAILPTPRPITAQMLRCEHAGAIALAPFTGKAPLRRWPLMHWIALEMLLLEAGYRVVILDYQTERCKPFCSPKLINRPPDEVAAVLRTCACVVSNDSAIQHLAGLFGAPTIVLASVFKGFSDPYPSALVLSGALGCEWCHGDYPRGVRDKHESEAIRREIGCIDGVCRSLGSITADRVLSAVNKRAYDQRRARTMHAFMGNLGMGAKVVETGCQRALRDFGAGMSTTTFNRAAWKLDWHFQSIDNDVRNLDLARSLVNHTDFVHADSVQALQDRACPIDGLYLDSLDTDSPGHAEHCLAEVQAALPKMFLGGAILIDDTFWDERTGHWWGKGKLAVPFLVEHDWTIVEDGYQVLLKRLP
jgi:hypothetical protein